MPEIIVKQLDSAWAPRLADIDRSEIVTTGYRQKGAAVEAYAVHWNVPRWFDGDAGEHSIGVRVRALQEVLARGAILFGAVAGDLLAGYAVLVPELHPGLAELKALFVSRPYRRSGIATRLVAEVVREAKERGARELYVSGTPSASAVGFYLRQGFRPTATPDPELLAREPEDIHMIMPLP